VDVHQFYEADQRRRDSEEHVYGDGWTDDADQHATYRLSWVVETGELYLVREPHPGGLLARYLDELHLDQADTDELRVEVLLTEPSEGAVQALLEGWEQVADDDDSLVWLRERVGRAAAAG